MHRKILPSIMRGLIVVLMFVVVPSSVSFVAFFIDTVSLIGIIPNFLLK